MYVVDSALSSLSLWSTLQSQRADANAQLAQPPYVMMNQSAPLLLVDHVSRYLRPLSDVSPAELVELLDDE